MVSFLINLLLILENVSISNESKITDNKIDAHEFVLFWFCFVFQYHYHHDCPLFLFRCDRLQSTKESNPNNKSSIELHILVSLLFKMVYTLNGILLCSIMLLCIVMCSILAIDLQFYA